jgi:hypothetical protein
MSGSRQCAVIVGVVLAACGVRNVNQDAHAVVVEYTSKHAAAAGAERIGHKDEILVGSIEHGVDHRVPVLVEWTVAKDAAGCLRVQTIKLTRNGGPTDTELYRGEAKAMREECASREILRPGSTEPVATFDDALVSYCWRWNGAINAAECAYQGVFTIRADEATVSGIVERPKK